jgi:hypothetical protein
MKYFYWVTGKALQVVTLFIAATAFVGAFVAFQADMFMFGEVEPVGDSRKH